MRYRNGIIINFSNLFFTGYVSDDELASLYKYAKGFIFPSLCEGFGLPPLEAIVLGCKSVALSDIPVFREIYNRGNYSEPLNDSKYFCAKQRILKFCFGTNHLP